MYNPTSLKILDLNKDGAMITHDAFVEALHQVHSISVYRENESPIVVEDFCTDDFSIISMVVRDNNKKIIFELDIPLSSVVFVCSLGNNLYEIGIGISALPFSKNVDCLYERDTSSLCPVWAVKLEFLKNKKD